MAYRHRMFRFIVQIDGLDFGGFSEVSGFDSSIDIMEYREGSMMQTPMKVPGLRKYGNVTLKNGVADYKILYDWLMGDINRAVQRKTITIILLGEESPVASWKVINAWPTKYTLSDCNSTSSEVAIELLEIAHEGMTRVL